LIIREKALAQIFGNQWREIRISINISQVAILAEYPEYIEEHWREVFGVWNDASVGTVLTQLAKDNSSLTPNMETALFIACLRAVGKTSK
jgi:hypothetical protein